ncbi:cytochrome P450 1A1-like isoform X2 [Oculina patagonica]
MAQKYGDVFSLMLGNRLVVVLNGVDAIQEAIVKHSIAFAGRPQLHTFKLANPQGNSLTVSDYSPKWRLSRKMSVSAIQTFAKNTEAFEEKLLQESQRLVHCFKLQKDKPVDALITTRFATANIILNALFGVDRSYDDEGLQEILELAQSYRQAVQASNHVDFLPLLKYLPNDALSNLVLALKAVKDDTTKMFVENKQTYTEGQVRNIADSFISIIEKETRKVKENNPAGVNTLNMAPLLADEQIIQVLGELYGATLDTTPITIYWSLAYLVKYPHIQRQLHEELDLVIGRGRFPTLGDIASLPLLQATVYEILRVTSIAPLAIPRSTTTETKIWDFTIPKDTMVFVNLWSVHRDPAVWKDPDVFNPRRFLNGAGEVIDPKSIGGFLPFSGGRRKCPGEVLALKAVPVFIAALLHSFLFSQDGLPAEYQGVNLQGQFGLTLMPETFYVRIEERYN